MSAFSFSTGQQADGLTAAQVAESRRLHGDNVLSPPPSVSLWSLYLEKYRDPVIQVLLLAAAVSLVLAFVKNDFVETIGIILAVFFATTVGFYFERDAVRRFSVLTALDEEQPVKVRREGRVVQVPRRDVVVGDIVLLEPGDEIPADARLLSSINLLVDESALTGEPVAEKGTAPSSEEQAEGHESTYPCWQLLRSSLVMGGRGEAVVTAVGDHTEIGKVARKSTEVTQVKTPLNEQLDRLAQLISKVGSAVSVAAFLIFLVHDIVVNTTLWHSTNYMGMAEVVLKYFMMAVTLIVMAVPEGLPMAVTLALALNMRRMLKGNNLVRRLHACETMGAVTVICTDKTGTLTENRMQVAEVEAESSASLKQKEESRKQKEESSASLKQKEESRKKKEESSELFLAMAVNSTAELDGEQGIGNPTEVALLRYLSKHGVDYRQLRRQAKVVAQEPFSTERKQMLTTVVFDNTTYTFLKGAPEVVLSRCELSAEKRKQIEDRLHHFQQRGMRTLALACVKQKVESRKQSDEREAFVFQAIVAISDPVRAEVPAAVADCLRAGIEVKIVTGDNALTALEIARQIGIASSSSSTSSTSPTSPINPISPIIPTTPFSLSPSPIALTGPEFAALTDEEALQVLPSLKVLSRARPTDKQRLVELLQRRGEVVAVTGDGTNDAPALHYAHVGLSLGSGTRVAKEASDMTLLDDSFRSVSRAVMWGRSLYHNLQRFLYFQLVVNVTALLLVLGGAFVGTEMPLTVTQILWVNLIMDTFAAMALASLAPSREVMNEKPRSRTAFIIPRRMGLQILFAGFLFFAVMFVFLLYCEFHRTDGVDPRELTWFFTTFVMLQFWNLFNAKALGSQHLALRHLFWNRGLVLVLVLILLGQVLIVQFGGRMFRTVPLSFTEWAVIVGITSLVLWVPESIRLLRLKVKARKKSY